MTFKSLKKLFGRLYQRHFGPREPFAMKIVSSPPPTGPLRDYLFQRGYQVGDEFVIVKKSDYLRLVHCARTKGNKFINSMMAAMYDANFVKRMDLTYLPNKID